MATVLRVAQAPRARLVPTPTAVLVLVIVVLDLAIVVLDLVNVVLDPVNAARMLPAVQVQAVPSSARPAVFLSAVHLSGRLACAAPAARVALKVRIVPVVKKAPAPAMASAAKKVVPAAMATAVRRRAAATSGPKPKKT